MNTTDVNRALSAPVLFGRVICGDNVAVLSGFPDECIDLVVTSPPYDDLRTYGGHSWNFETLAAQLVRVLKPGGVVVWVVADATVNGSESGTSMRQALHFQSLGLNLHDTMVYEKAGTGACGSNLAYWQTWEFMFVMANGRPKAVNRLKTQNLSAGVTASRSAGKRAPIAGEVENGYSIGSRVIEDEGVRANIWRYNVNKHGMENTGHPAPFPIALAKDHVASWSNPGDVVLDPFAGSGTTLKAAKELNRQFVGIEINPDYCTICEARLAQDVLLLETSDSRPNKALSEVCKVSPDQSSLP